MNAHELKCTSLLHTQLFLQRTESHRDGDLAACTWGINVIKIVKESRAHAIKVDHVPYTVAKKKFAPRGLVVNADCATTARVLLLRATTVELFEVVLVPL